jgi:hypothetical protein
MSIIEQLHTNTIGCNSVVHWIVFIDGFYSLKVMMILDDGTKMKTHVEPAPLWTIVKWIHFGVYLNREGG